MVRKIENLSKYWFFLLELDWLNFNLIFVVSVDEFLQEAENLGVQDLPRSGSSMSVRTDASGTAVSALQNTRFLIYLVIKF